MNHLHSRRQFFQLASLCGLSWVAGCGGGDGPSEADGTGNPADTTNAGSDAGAGTPPVVESPTPVSILLPAYFYDANLWQSAITRRTPAHKIIANVSNGPGKAPDGHFHQVFAQALASGHSLIGYVATGYGKIPVQTVIGQVLAWRNFYGVQHFFLDEASIKLSDIGYYRQIVEGILAASPQAQIILNPGAIPDPAYFALSPQVEIVVFESTWTNFQKLSFPSWMAAWRKRSHIIVFDAPQEALAAIYSFVSRNQGSGFFVTDAREAYYNKLPGYWELELAM